jgi:cellulose synthase/poly-beta-1,6-N-acetylglucosamine synthase-like glycosyltransferase
MARRRKYFKGNGSMYLIATILLWFGALPVAIACSVVFAECLFALVAPRRRSQYANVHRPSLAVLIPAHNEAFTIPETIRAIQQQLASGDRLLVVADNCTDQTATLSRGCGAETIERHDPTLRGKGYALAFGIEHLAQKPPEALVLMDADTLPQAEALDHLARMVETTGRPAQAIYTLDPPANPEPRDFISCLAFTIRNAVRPRGLARFGFPVPITGTGIALPWRLVESVSLNTSNLVEDMQLGIDLALRGSPALLCPAARVLGRLPGDVDAAKSQRTRWEHGHLKTLLIQTPRLIWHSIKSRRLDLFVMAVDLAVPPLSLLLICWFGATCIALIAGWQGLPVAPAAVLAVSGGLFGAAILTCWLRHFRQLVPWCSLLSIPYYVLWKIPLYVAFFVRPQKEWLRTHRDHATT